jgi:putative phosphoribosyl transferase
LTGLTKEGDAAILERRAVDSDRQSDDDPNTLILGGYMSNTLTTQRTQKRQVSIPVGSARLEGNLCLAPEAKGMVLFAHGSGSSRHSPRNRFVAQTLHEGRLATLLIDLLTQEEEEVDLQTRRLRFDIELLAERLVYASDWLAENPDTRKLKIGYFGASTGAAAALVAAAERPGIAGAVVSRGGRPDLAGSAVTRVTAPTLLIVGERDFPVIAVNRQSLERISAEKQLVIVPRATHLFEEPGTLDRVALLARDWFERHLPSGQKTKAMAPGETFQH